MSKYNNKFFELAVKEKYNIQNVNRAVTMLDKLKYEVLFASQDRIIAIYDNEKLEINSEIVCIDDVFEFTEEQYNNWISAII